MLKEVNEMVLTQKEFLEKQKELVDAQQVVTELQYKLQTEMNFARKEQLKNNINKYGYTYCFS